MDSRLHRNRLGLAGMLFVVALSGAAAVVGCGSDPSTSARSAEPRVAEGVPSPETHSGASRALVDLDGDDEEEQVWLGLGPGAVWIVDGPITYRAREKWLVRVAALGDSDRDGLPEVIALVEDDDGLHVALFAWRRDRYRERIVTSALSPRPTGLNVRHDPTAGGDVIDLAEGDGALSTYRWNGFGFTTVGGVEAGR